MISWSPEDKATACILTTHRLISHFLGLIPYPKTFCSAVMNFIGRATSCSRFGQAVGGKWNTNRAAVNIGLNKSLLSPCATDAFKHSRCINTVHFQRRQFSNNDEETKEQPALSQKEMLIYESPFAALTLKLKRVSLTSAVIGINGLPILSIFYGAGDVPATGQLAVIATAGATAVGSTILLGYCFSPYVHTMELLNDDINGELKVKMVTRDILARQVETIFDPATEVSPPAKNNTRPFCNFMVRGKPFYIHPDLVKDDKVRVQLVAEDQEAVKEIKKKTDDDEFL